MEIVPGPELEGRRRTNRAIYYFHYDRKTPGMGWDVVILQFSRKESISKLKEFVLMKNR